MPQDSLCIELSPDEWLLIQDAVDSHTRALDDVGRERQSNELFNVGQRLRRAAQAALRTRLEQGGQT